MKSRRRIFACLLLLVVCAVAHRGQAQEKAADISAAPIAIGETWQLTSKKLNEVRTIRVALPASYARSSQRYPVIYTTDGEGLFLPTASAMQFMTTASELPQMPEAIVVAIPNTNRGRDMPVPQQYGRGGEENFLAFLADELVPFIEARYRTQPLRVLIGHSQGGTFAHYALVTRPTVFAWILPVDGPLFDPLRPLLEKTKDLIHKDAKFRGRLVTVERQLGWMKDWPSLLQNAPKSFYGARVEITDESHETMVYKGIYEGLKRLFHDYAPEDKGLKLAALEARYKMLSEAYGYAVNIPLRVLLVSAGRNASQLYGEEAVKLARKAEAVYGESPATKRMLAEAEAAAKKGGPDPRVAEFLNLPPVSAEKMKPFLGTWEGRKEVPNGVPLDLSLTFSVEGETVRGQGKWTGPRGGQIQFQVEFMRVLQDGTLQWGGRASKSGGIDLSTAKLTDENTLNVSEELIGATPPPSLNIDPKSLRPITFTCKRKTGEKKTTSSQITQEVRFINDSFSAAPQTPRGSSSVNRKEIHIGAAAPDWQLKTVAGETVRLSELRGKVVVLDFWASWCGPCRKLVPAYEQLARTYQNQPVKFYSISIWPGPNFNPQTFLQEHKLASTLLIGNDAVANSYGVWSVPTLFAIDPQGRFAYINVPRVVDPDALGKQLRETIESALPKDQIAYSSKVD